MASPIERWAKQAVLLEKKECFDPVADSRVLDDVSALARLHRATWRRRQSEILLSGVPAAMPQGSYAGLAAYPPAQTTTTTSISGTVNLWPNLIFTPIPLNGMMAPQILRVSIIGKIVTVATPGNIGFNPLINSVGTWTTGGTAVSGGSTLGATGNVALTASITDAFYYIFGDLTIRNTGTAGVIVAMLHCVSTQGTSGGLAGPAAVGTGMNLLFGGTAVTVDLQTTAQSFQLGAVHTVTTITHKVEQAVLAPWN